MTAEVKPLNMKLFVKVVDETKATEDVGDEYGHKIIEDQICLKVHYWEGEHVMSTVTFRHMWNILEWLVYSLFIKEILCYSYLNIMMLCSPFSRRDLKPSKMSQFYEFTSYFSKSVCFPTLQTKII